VSFITDSKNGQEVSMTKRTNLLITLQDYERIFRTIHGVLLTEKADIPRSCLFFGVVGAAILQNHYGVAAIPVVGPAIYKIGDQSNDAIAFAQFGPKGELQASTEAFHCWVEVDGWCIDFIAPLFQEMVESSGRPCVIDRKMFQKQVPTDIEAHVSLEKAGDFICLPDHELTNHLIEEYFNKPAMGDLVQICVEWFKRPPQEMIPTLGVADQHGKIKPVTLSPLRITGAW
jgi:hypothetical protein